MYFLRTSTVFFSTCFNIPQLLESTFKHITEFDYRVFLMGTGFLGIILTMKQIGKV